MTEINIYDKNIWICNDGRVLYVDEMEDTHLINSINMLIRNCAGETDLLPLNIRKKYERMIQEKEKRNLSDSPKQNDFMELFL